MVVPYIAVCPTCGSRIYLRIQDGSYINSYPIRINCGKCKTLIRGVYSMYGTERGISLENAVLRDAVPNAETLELSAEYVCEVSGELISKPIQVFQGKIGDLSPFMRASQRMSGTILQNWIIRLKQFKSDFERWWKEYYTAFQLLQDRSLTYIPEVMRNRMDGYEYPLNNELKILHALHYVFLDSVQNLFFPRRIESIIAQIHFYFEELPADKLEAFIDAHEKEIDFLSCYTKLMDVFMAFMRIYPNLIPAEASLRYRDINSDDGISTCTFSDIKSFYFDTYESVLSLIQIPVSIDNIIKRHDYFEFGNTAIKNKVGEDKNNRLHEYIGLDKGFKLKRIASDEPFQGLLDFPKDNRLRNGIGHNNLYYDGERQIIQLLNKAKQGEVVHSISLLDMARECLAYVRASVVISELILFLMRYKERRGNGRSAMTPGLYPRNIGPNDRCPCGSGLKYKRCCKTDVESMRNKQVKA